MRSSDGFSMEFPVRKMKIMSKFIYWSFISLSEFIRILIAHLNFYYDEILTGILTGITGLTI